MTERLLHVNDLEDLIVRQEEISVDVHQLRTELQSANDHHPGTEERPTE